MKGERTMDTIKNLVSDLLEMDILPADSQIVEKKDFVSCDYVLTTRSLPINVQLTIKKRFLILSANRKYSYHVREGERIKFNGSVKQVFPAYQIAGNNDSIVVSRRCIYETSDMAKETVADFNEDCQKVIREFEDQCVDFHVRSVQPDIEPKKAESVEVPIEERDGYASDYIDDYMEEQKCFTVKIFQQLSGESKIQQSENIRWFQKKAGEDELVVALDEAEPLDMCFKFLLPSTQKEAYVMAAYLEKTYPELLTSYKNNKFEIYSYMTPDRYEPGKDITKCISLLKNAANEATQSVADLEKPEQMVSNMQIILEQEMETLKQKEKQIDLQKEALAKQEKNLTEKENVLREREETFRKKIAEKEVQLQQKQEQLKVKYQELQVEQSSIDEEKAKYLLNIQNLTAEIARLQKRTGVEATGAEGTLEIKKLKSKLQSEMNQRISMERNLKIRIKNLEQQLQNSAKDLENALAEKDILKQESMEDASHLFDEERKKYEAELKTLREYADITGAEVTPDELVTYIQGKGAENVEILHAAEGKEIVSMLIEGINIKVVFGSVPFLDASKIMKNVNVKDFSKLNSLAWDYKFFIRSLENGQEAVVRNYFNRKMTSAEVYEAIIKATSYFE